MRGIPLLYKTITSHLVVAIVPALALGFFVSEVNRKALEIDAQHLHIATAGQLQEKLRARIDATVQVLEEAERVLASEELPLEKRVLLLRALVATGNVPELVMFAADGKSDTVIRGPDTPEGQRPELGEDIRREARERGWSTDHAVKTDDGMAVRLVVPWIVQEELFGFLGTTLTLSTLDDFAKGLAEKHLGAEGQVDVVDSKRRVLVSSQPDRAGQTLGNDSPFRGISGGDRDGLASVDAGTSVSFDDPTGLPRLGAVVSMPSTRWLVGVSRPRRVAFAVLAAVKKRTMLFALLAGALAGIAGLLFARQISTPIRLLTQEAQTAASRGFRTTVQLNADGEIGALAASFNNMLAQLDKYRADLRIKTNLRMKLARILSPAELHELLAAETTHDQTSTEHIATVIYVDVASTGKDLTTTVRHEYLVTMLGDFFAAAVASVENHGGRVDRYSGDAVIGVFLAESGADHGVRAVEAARAILKDVAEMTKRWSSIDAALDASIGVASGTARVRMIEDGGGNEISVSGEIVDMAADLQRDAVAGAVSLDPQTQAMLQGPTV